MRGEGRLPADLPIHSLPEGFGLAGSIEFAFHFALLNAMIYLLTHNCPTQRTTCTLNSIVGKEGHQETVRDCVSFVAAVVG
jgi:hypothetical protein